MTALALYDKPSPDFAAKVARSLGLLRETAARHPKLTQASSLGAEDMVVTHLFQILAFMAMEPPTALEPQPISEEKNKVFRSMLPIQPTAVVRGALELGAPMRYITH